MDQQKPDSSQKTEVTVAQQVNVTVNIGFRGFLRENWPWIVGPIVFGVVIVIVALFFLGGDETSPFIYNIF